MFCLPGVAVTTLCQWEDYHGLGGNANKPLSRTTAVPVLPYFAANLLALVGLFRYHYAPDGVTLRRLFDWQMVPIALFALVGEVANQTSIILAGSLTFTVVYSSVTIWTALFGIPLLHKRPNTVQWTAIIVIVLGLLASAASHTAVKHKSTLQYNSTVYLHISGNLSASEIMLAAHEAEAEAKAAAAAKAEEVARVRHIACCISTAARVFLSLSLSLPPLARAPAVQCATLIRLRRHVRDTLRVVPPGNCDGLCYRRAMWLYRLDLICAHVRLH